MFSVSLIIGIKTFLSRKDSRGQQGDSDDDGSDPTSHQWLGHLGLLSVPHTYSGGEKGEFSLSSAIVFV